MYFDKTSAAILFYANYLKLLKGDSDPPYIFIKLDMLATKIHWKKNYRRQIRVKAKKCFWLPDYFVYIIS